MLAGRRRYSLTGTNGPCHSNLTLTTFYSAPWCWKYIVRFLYLLPVYNKCYIQRINSKEKKGPFIRLRNTMYQCILYIYMYVSNFLARRITWTDFDDPYENRLFEFKNPGTKCPPTSYSPASTSLTIKFQTINDIKT